MFDNDLYMLTLLHHEKKPCHLPTVDAQNLPSGYNRQHGGLPPGDNQSKKSSIHDDVGWAINELKKSSNKFLYQIKRKRTIYMAMLIKNAHGHRMLAILVG